MLNGKSFLIVSYRGFENGGGGEMYLYQTALYAIEQGMKTAWLSFVNHKLEAYIEEKITKNAEGIFFININGGYDSNKLEAWLKLLKPYMIHHQGHKRLEICSVARKLNIHVLTGYHFWLGAVRLDSKYKNIDILENIKYHKPSDEYSALESYSNVTKYACSSFFNNVLEKIGLNRIELVINPSSSSILKIKDLDQKQKIFVTCCNLHKLKGGLVFKYLILNGVNIPLLGIISEPGSEILDKEILALTRERNSRSGCQKVVIANHVNDMKSIYAKTRVLLIPSIVDETFCRVANEGLMNNIPIITTGAGNIKYMLGDAAIYVDKDDHERWLSEAEKAYHSERRSERRSERMQKQYETVSEETSKKTFLKAVKGCITKSKHGSVCIFVPWCDQGLGLQARNYAKILSENFRVSIFSFKPYIVSKGTAENFQRNPDEWKMEEIPVYYSKNKRESVTDKEIIDHIKKYEVGHFIIPETCWNRVFEIGRLLRGLQVNVYAIPNIEIVRKSEVAKHAIFNLILCNNMLCKRIFEDYNFTNTKYIGYSVPTTSIESKRTEDPFTFLNVGGLNAFTRKQSLKVCEAFVRSKLGETGKCELIVCVQAHVKSEIKRYENEKGIKLILKHLSNREIDELYEKTDVTIQVSKHEGLGLGFYDSISKGIPVLTIDGPPHNEIIKDGVNGWIIPCKNIPMEDNSEALFESMDFEVEDLSNALIKIYQNKKIDKKDVKKDYEERTNYESFKKVINNIFV